MQTKVTISPVSLAFNSDSQPMSILFKYRRTLISTDYAIENYEAKSKIPLKNNKLIITDSDQISCTFTISRHMELQNTKVDVIIIGCEDVNCLGKCTLDLGLFHHCELKPNQPVTKQFSYLLDKSSDKNAKLRVLVTLQVTQQAHDIQINHSNKRVNFLSSRGKKEQAIEPMGLLETEAQHREEFLMRRRTKVDQPSAYEISHRNYKNVEITRDDKSDFIDKKSQSKGSKRRFQYQYQKETFERSLYNSEGEKVYERCPKEHQQHKDTINNRKQNTKKANEFASKTKIRTQNASPLPRIDTPEPFKDNQSQALQKESRDSVSTSRNRNRATRDAISDFGLKKKTSSQVIGRAGRNVPQTHQDSQESCDKYHNRQKHLNSMNSSRGKASMSPGSQNSNKFRQITQKLRSIEQKIMEKNRKNDSQISSRLKSENEQSSQFEGEDIDEIEDIDEDLNPRKPKSPYKEQDLVLTPRITKQSEKVSPSVGKQISEKLPGFDSCEESVKDEHVLRKGQIKNQSNQLKQSSKAIDSGVNQSGSSKEGLYSNKVANFSPGQDYNDDKEEAVKTVAKSENFHNTDRQQHPGTQFYYESKDIALGELSQAQGDLSRNKEPSKVKQKQMNHNKNGDFSQSNQKLRLIDPISQSKPGSENANKQKNKNQQLRSDNNINKSVRCKMQNQYNYIIESSTDQQQRSIGAQLHLQCLKKINNLELFSDEQQEIHRKRLMEKQLQYKTKLNSLKSQQEKTKQQLAEMQSRIKSYELDSRNHEEELRKKQSLIDKLNRLYEESDDKNFEVLKENEKTIMQHKRQLDVYAERNRELQNQLQQKEQQLGLLQQKWALNTEGRPPAEGIDTQSRQGAYHSSEEVSQIQNRIQQKYAQRMQQQQKLHTQTLKLEKQRCINLETKVRIAENSMRFLKIELENLREDNRKLENEIDTIVADDRYELARHGSLAKLNLSSNSLSVSMQNENKMLKSEIVSLKTQVHELNQLLESLIVNKNSHQEQLQKSRKLMGMNTENSRLLNQYQVLEKKVEAYEQELESKQRKVAEILNLIWKHGDHQLMDQIDDQILGK